MRTRVKEVQGVDWFDAAVMNCLWEGPRLRDVLLSVGLQMGQLSANRHVQFASYGSKVQEDDWYGGSIPLERAMDPEMDVILAVKVGLDVVLNAGNCLCNASSHISHLWPVTKGPSVLLSNLMSMKLILGPISSIMYKADQICTQMNHEPLSSRHGFPVRSIVPGVLGARSVKWLDRITISDQESPCFYQRHDYKVLPPEAVDAESAEKYWASTPAMLDMPVNACVAYPTSGSTITLSDPTGIVHVRGYAVPSGSDGPVVRVQVSTDEGETWVDAVLNNGGELASKWSWVLWNADVKIEKGRERKIWAKATDKGGNTQKEEKSTWNLRGVGYNGYEAVYDLTVQ